MLSIILISYNTREALRRCLASIQQHRGTLSIETILVDNGSRDGTVAMVKESMPEAIIVEPGFNSWFSGGANFGLTAVTGDYALILNPDTVLQPGALQRVLSYMRDNPQVGAATCQMRSLDHQLQMTGSRIPGYWDLLLDYTPVGIVLFWWRRRRHDSMWYNGWDRSSTRAVGVIPDSFLIAPTALLRRIEGYDEQLKLYFTEDDLCIRVQEQGYECHFVADAVVLHEEHVSTSQVKQLASRVYFSDLLRFSRKYYGRWPTLVLRVLSFPLRQSIDLMQGIRERRTTPIAPSN